MALFYPASLSGETPERGNRVCDGDVGFSALAQILPVWSFWERLHRIIPDASLAHAFLRWRLLLLLALQTAPFGGAPFWACSPKLIEREDFVIREVFAISAAPCEYVIAGYEYDCRIVLMANAAIVHVAVALIDE